MKTLNSTTYARKTLWVTGAGVLFAFLFLAPLMASAAGSVTVTTDRSSYTGSATMTVSGVVAPAPGSGTAVGIAIKAPNGQTIDAANAAVDGTTGAYSTTFTVGGPSYTVNGTYTVAVAAANGATNTATFSYGCSSCTGTQTTSGGSGTTTTVMITTTVVQQLQTTVTQQVQTTVVQQTTVTQQQQTTVTQQQQTTVTLSYTGNSNSSTGLYVGAVGVVIAIVAGALSVVALRRK